MPSYLVSGASRGIGFEFIRQLSADPNNVVIGLARNKAATDEKVTAEFPGRKNLTIVQGDLVDVDSLKKAASETEKITGGSLDVLIANAGLMPYNETEYTKIDKLSENVEKFNEELQDMIQVNLVGQVHLIRTFLPLIQKGQLKKIVAVSTGLSDLDATMEVGMDWAVNYSISKAALNMALAKFQIVYQKEGIVIMGVCPGAVNTGNFPAEPTSEYLAAQAELGQKFGTYAPHFKGLATPEESVRDMLKVVDNANMEKNAGRLVSHFGNKQWL